MTVLEPQWQHSNARGVRHQTAEYSHKGGGDVHYLSTQWIKKDVQQAISPIRFRNSIQLHKNLVVVCNKSPLAAVSEPQDLPPACSGLGPTGRGDGTDVATFRETCKSSDHQRISPALERMHKAQRNCNFVLTETAKFGCTLSRPTTFQTRQISLLSQKVGHIFLFVIPQTRTKIYHYFFTLYNKMLSPL